VQSDIASRVAGSLQVALASGERSQLSERPTENLAAYEAYLRGEEAFNALAAGDVSAERRAIRFYERAVALDSTFARAWARMARAQAQVHSNFPGTKAGTSARRAAERALALAPESPESHVALGDYYYLVAREPAQAARHMDAALRIAPDDAGVLAAAANIDFALGRWERARERLQRAASLDPRSALTASLLGQALLWLRRYPEAAEALERALVLSPEDLANLQFRSKVELAQGDLAGARAVLRSAPSEVDRTALAVHMGVYFDLGWVLDDAAQQLLLGSPPEAFHDDRLGWAAVHAQLYAHRGDLARSRAYADSARLVAEGLLRDTPEDAQLYTLLGIALAYVGQREEAMRAGERAVNLQPISKDAYLGPYLQHQLARIYILAGEHEKALDQLEPLVKTPYYLSPGWLRIDPTFAPLRGNGRFDRLTAGR
jgi:tetratricopeptide (TPR) repeat protein